MRHCDRDTVSERLLRRRGESPTTGTKADQWRRAFSGAVRYHGRESDPDARGAFARCRNYDRGGEGAGAGAGGGGGGPNRREGCNWAREWEGKGGEGWWL